MIQIRHNPDESLLIHMLYADGPAYWLKTSYSTTHSFRDANAKLEDWSISGPARVHFAIYINKELVYDGDYLIRRGEAANLKGQVNTYLEHVIEHNDAYLEEGVAIPDPEDAEVLLGILAEANPKLKKGFIDPDTGAWMSRRRFEEGVDIVSEPIVEDPNVVDDINAALLAGTVGIGQHGLVTEVTREQIREGTPDPTHIPHTIERARRMGRQRAETETPRGYDAALRRAQQQIAHRHRERRLALIEYVLIPGQFNREWLVFDPDDDPFASVMIPPNLSQRQIKNVVETAIMEHYEGSSFYPDTDNVWRVKPAGNRDDDSFDVIAVEKSRAIDEGWIPPNSEVEQAWLSEKYGRSVGLNSDWISDAWDIGHSEDGWDYYITDAEDEDDNGNNLYSIVRRRETPYGYLEDEILFTGTFDEVKVDAEPCGICGRILSGAACLFGHPTW